MARIALGIGPRTASLASIPLQPASALSDVVEADNAAVAGAKQYRGG